MMRELADVNRRPLSTIFERSWGSEEVLEDCKKAKSYFLEGGSSNLQAGQPHLQPWGDDEQINLRAISLMYGVKEGDWK